MTCIITPRLASRATPPRVSRTARTTPTMPTVPPIAPERPPSVFKRGPKASNAADALDRSREGGGAREDELEREKE